MTGSIILSVNHGGMGEEADEAARWLGQLLLSHGLPVLSRQVIMEDESALETALRGALEAAPLVVTLGSGTSSELIRRVISRVTGARLVLNNKLLNMMEEEYASREEAMPRRAERLALIPQGALLWPGAGGEPSFVVETPRAAVIVLPNSSESIAALIDKTLLPYVRGKLEEKGPNLLRRFKIAGMKIGDVEEQLGGELKGTDWSASCVAGTGEVEVHLKAKGSTRALAEAALADGEAKITEKLGDAIYGRDQEQLEAVVGRLLKDRGLTLSVAESCTGGLLAHRLTNVSGSSAYFERGVVVYSNQAKEELLGVPAEILRRHGAVSAPVAEAMARGIQQASKATLALSVTGIAGPEGGTPAKPVGTVFIALASPEGVEARRFRFRGDRGAIKWQSAQAALELLRRHLVNSFPVKSR